MIKRLLKRSGPLILALVLTLTVFAAGGEAEALTRTLRKGDSGDLVLEIKNRLYDLGYYTKSRKFGKQFNEQMEELIISFQERNGLEQTGEIDQATYDTLYSETAVKMPRPTLVPLATPGPAPEPDWPERDADGYLAGDGEYFYENDEEGLWIYLGKNLQIRIRRCRDERKELSWFETDIRTRNGEAFRTVATNPDKPGKQYRYPFDIAADEHFVLGFSDDFYAERMKKKSADRPGIIIRSGAIYSDLTNSKTGHHLPNLDMMAQYPDGSLNVYLCNELTAEELLEKGAVNVFSFGPYLVRNGEINPLVYDYYRSIEPRHALGMIEPGHYLLLSVEGRTRSSKGPMLQRVAEMMREHGVREALNLDGGNTMALIFRGRMLNKLATYKNKEFVRTVTSLIGIGYTDNIEE